MNIDDITTPEEPMEIINSESSPELKLFDRRGQPFAFDTSGDFTGHAISIGPSRAGKCSSTSTILQALLKQRAEDAQQNSDLFK